MSATLRELIEDQRGWLILGASKEREGLLHALINVAEAAEELDRQGYSDGADEEGLGKRLDELERELRAWDEANP